MKFPEELLRRLVAIALVLLISLGFSSLTAQPAAASIRTMEEVPGQMLYQSRHSLRDNRGEAWQVILFKRSKADRSTSLHLRLVSFPGTAEFVHPQPLTLTARGGERWEAKDVLAEKAPAANVGEYDLNDILNRVPNFGSVQLALVMSNNFEVAIAIPPEIVLEWQTVAGSP